MSDSACPYKVITNPCFEFIVPKEKEEILMKKEEEVELPEGYSIGKWKGRLVYCRNGWLNCLQRYNFTNYACKHHTDRITTTTHLLTICTQNHNKQLVKQ